MPPERHLRTTSSLSLEALQTLITSNRNQPSSPHQHQTRLSPNPNPHRHSTKSEDAAIVKASIAAIKPILQFSDKLCRSCLCGVGSEGRKTIRQPNNSIASSLPECILCHSHILTESTLRLPIRPHPAEDLLQCDACDSFLFLDHMRCLQCGLEVCLDCYVEWIQSVCRGGEAMVVVLEKDSAKKSRWDALCKCKNGELHVFNKAAMKGSLEGWSFLTAKMRRVILAGDDGCLLTDASASQDTRECLPLRFPGTASEDTIADAWAKRVPIVVEGIAFQHKWDPASLEAAMVHDDTIKARARLELEIVEMRFSEFVENLERDALKGFDFPLTHQLAQLLPDHMQEFNTTIPFRRVLTKEGPLSLFSFLPTDVLAQIHGPTLFISVLTPPNHPTTRLHKDGAGAYNALLWAENASQPGALWHIFTREDTKVLERVYNRPDEDAYPLLCFDTYFGETELQNLVREHGVKPVVIEQRVGEMILIPAGCAHQVRNLQLCVKVSISKERAWGFARKF
ncbi:hypothetical protein HDU98_009797 [Podochytrium sp. JEL0797]|nr:hypothetical protein HDU98_009797 [Podochytrium sp. JEL0797]